jgi:hypothetical protein
VIYARYTIHGHMLQEVDSSKYLGVTISKDLRWDDHINTITPTVVVGPSVSRYQDVGGGNSWLQIFVLSRLVGCFLSSMGPMLSRHSPRLVLLVLDMLLLWLKLNPMPDYSQMTACCFDQYEIIGIHRSCRTTSTQWKNMSTCSPFASFRAISSMVMTSCVSHDRFERKPCWLSHNMECSSRWSITWLFPTFARQWNHP